MSRTGAVRVRAYAKINLLLRVGPRQPNGYHGLETVFQALRLHDTLVCAPTRGAFGLACDDPAVPADERNLVWKAARALWRALGRPGEPARCAVTIGKRIQLQAGLGGGSADAAAAIVALHRVWTGRLSSSELAAVAAGVGADVPYFLVGGTALGLGRGDDVYPLPDAASRWIVLACPPFGVATAEAYGWLDQDRGGGIDLAGRRAPVLAAWAGRELAVANDLEAPVVRRHPAIAALVDVLAGAGAEAAAMSGSGSTVFGVFGTERRARLAAHAAAASGAQAIVTRTAPRAWCRRALAG